MGRFSGGITPTGIGSVTLPMHSIFASAAVAFTLRQLIIVNSAATEVHVGLRKFTAQGTAPDTGVEVPHDVESAAATATIKQTHTVTPTFVSGALEEVHLAAAIGATMVWTFNDGIRIGAGTGNGLGLVLMSGVGQIVLGTYTWDE